MEVELNFSQVQSAYLDPTFTLKLNARNLGNSTATKSNIIIICAMMRGLLALVIKAYRRAIYKIKQRQKLYD